MGFVNYFASQKSKHIKAMIATNIYAQTFLTHTFLPAMLKRNQRSAIIDLSSISADICNATSSVYGATKAYNAHLAKCLAGELPPDKVDLLCVKPGPTSTPLTGKFDETKMFFGISAGECVSGAVVALGRRAVSYGSWKHDLV
jgi:short-subunit dehydrogenase